MATSLADRWRSHTAACGINEDVSRRYWDIVQAKYSEPQRCYHTLRHLEDIFHHFDTVQEDLQKPYLVAMAIFFHDIIYQPKESDNEEKSAELFKEFAQESPFLKNSEDERRVVGWILETKRHQTEVHTSRARFGFSDLYFFLDMDMAVLGCPSDEYREYAKNIKKEYSHYSEEDFSRRRAKVLKQFLKVPNIYATQYFREQFENKARGNIQAEIDELEEKAG